MNTIQATSLKIMRLVLSIPAEDFEIYVRARRILRCLMGRQAPSIESLILHDLRGRDADGVADGYMDSTGWPIEGGRAVTVRMQQQAKRGGLGVRRKRRAGARLRGAIVDPIRN